MGRSTVFVWASLGGMLGVPGWKRWLAGLPLFRGDRNRSRDYALHGETAPVVPPRQPPILAEAILDLLEDPDKRATLVDRAHRVVAEYPTWSESAHALETPR